MTNSSLPHPQCSLKPRWSMPSRSQTPPDHSGGAGSSSVSADLAAAVFNTSVPSAGFPAMAASTAPLDTTAGPVLLPLAGSRCGSTNGYRTSGQPQANTQIAFPVSVAPVAPNAIARPASLLSNPVTAVRHMGRNRCLQGSSRRSGCRRHSLRSGNQHQRCR